MRILHVITSLRTGGAEKLMVDLLPRMKQQGHRVDLCVFDGVQTPFYEELERKGVKVIPLGHSVYSPLHIFKLIPLMKQYDVVHAHNTACQYYVAVAGCFSSCKKFTTEHNTTNKRRGRGWWLCLDRWMYKRYDRIVCISNETYNNLLLYLFGNEKVANSQFVVVYNGIDVEYYRNVMEAQKEENFTIMMVGAFRWEKDQKTVIRALKYLNAKYKVWFVGGGDDALKQECEALAKKEGVTERVFMLGVREDVKNLYAQASVIVQSSHVDGFCLAAVEGMASGRPVIVADIPGMGDVVRGYGILFPHEDERALSDAIVKVCEDRDYREEIVTRCLERAKMFSIDVMTQKYLDLYKE